MNFLAHMYLSCFEHDLMCGNFLGDFIKNKELKSLPKEWMRGIKLHRVIDSFTDTHREVRKCTKLLHPSQGKYSPVAIDVFFDYVLYRNWDHYSEVGFDDFEEQVYSILNTHLEEFPGRLKNMSREMINDRFLRSYTSYEGLEFTFEMMKRRFKFKSNIENAVEDLKRNYDEIDKRFNRFFPEMIKVAESFCAC